MGRKTHKHGNQITLCGRQCWGEEDSRARCNFFWPGVTCLSCLAKKQRRKK